MGAKDSLLEPLPVSLAVTLGIVYTALYVLPFYISATTRPSPTLSRSDPTIIKARVRLVTLTCIVCTPVTVLVLQSYTNLSLADIIRIMGLWPVALMPTVNVVLLTAILFAGPLFERGFVESGWRRWIRGSPLRETLETWIGWRNFVAGPSSEEYLFRALLLPIYVLSSLSSSSSFVPLSSSPELRITPSSAVLLSPLPFALAHLHHLHETRLMYPDHPLLPLFLGGVLQFAYTSLFGWFAAFAFVRTGSLLGVIISHAFCNWMGLPRVWGWVEPAEIATYNAGESWESDFNALRDNTKPGDTGPEPQDVVDEMFGMEDSDDGHGCVRARRVRRGDKAARVLGIDQPTAQHVKKSAVDMVTVYTAMYYVLLIAGAVAFKQLLWPLTEAGTYSIHG